MGVLSRLQRWLRDDRAPRYAGERLAIFCWGSGVPVVHRIRNISMTGAYVTNIEQWPVGTVIQGLLREVPDDGEEISESLSMAVSFQVARLGPDGLGIIFALQTKEELVVLKKLVDRARASSERAGGSNASTQEQDRPRRRFNTLE